MMVRMQVVVKVGMFVLMTMIMTMFMPRLMMMVMVMVMVVVVMGIVLVPMSVMMLVIVIMPMLVMMSMLVNMPLTMSVLLLVSVIMSVIMSVIVPMVPMMVVMMMLVVMVRVRFRSVMVKLHLPLAHVRVEMPDDGAKYVRLAGKFARAGAVADRFDDHRREALRELVHDRGNYACAGRRRHLELVRCRRDRQALHHLESRRRRNRVQAVIALHSARTERYRGRVNAFRLQRVDGQRNADHVGDRIDGADFVEVDLLDGNAVNFPFGGGDFLEDGQGKRSRTFAQAGRGDHSHNVGIMAVMLGRMVRVRVDVELER